MNHYLLVTIIKQLILIVQKKLKNVYQSKIVQMFHLKNFQTILLHIIRFFGVAQKDSKFYLVTEWMDHGNLREYYTNFKNHMNWETKIKFALDICRGVSYLHDCGVSQIKIVLVLKKEIFFLIKYFF